MHNRRDEINNMLSLIIHLYFFLFALPFVIYLGSGFAGELLIFNLGFYVLSIKEGLYLSVLLGISSDISFIFVLLTLSRRILWAIAHRISDAR